VDILKRTMKTIAGVALILVAGLVDTGSSGTQHDKPLAPNEGGGSGIIAYCYQPLSGPAPKEIWTIRIDGSEDQQISNSTIGLNHHDWSPYGSQLAAVGYVDANTWSIYTFDADGGNQVRLTTTSNVWDSEPVWSPDASHISFTRIYPDAGYREELWLMDSDGSNQHYIGVEGFGARWSADGTRFLFHAPDDDGENAVTCNVDGSDVQVVADTDYEIFMPIWSPDETRIAFVTERHGNWEIYVMDTDGSNHTRLTTSTTDNFTPRWSPDGSLIAFNSDRQIAGKWEVHLMNADGTNVRQVTDTPTGISAINADWQPLPCVCGMIWGDVTGDPAVNPTDVVIIVNFVYKADDMRFSPPECPYETGDVNCSGGMPNPTDVVVYVNYVYKAITPFPCDPCQ